MPATEQTWRNSKLLHVIFGLSAIVMLLTTIWMLWVDHAREWKDVQRTFMRVETWTAQSRINELEDAKFASKGKDFAADYKAAQAEVPPKEQVDVFLKIASKSSDDAESTAASARNLRAVEKAYQALVSEKDLKADQATLIKRRDDLIAAMKDVLSRATFDENRLSRKLKDSRARLDDIASRYALGVDEGLEADELAQRMAATKAQQEVVNDALLASQATTTHRKDLETAFNAIQANELAAKKKVDDHEGDLTRLQDARAAIDPAGNKSLLGMPIIDAFGSPYKIDQVWLPNLTLNNNFRDVARFDRCITCHKGIDKTAPGFADKPGYPHVEPVMIALGTPETRPEGLQDDTPLNEALNAIYGMRLANQGLIKPEDVTVEVVWPETVAAQALLQSGDVIEMIGDVKISSHKLAQRYLVDGIRWDKPLAEREPLKIKVRRGLPHPFASHPRLDLFVGSLSPHKLGDVGCTICHDGQGSATAFKWASHTPNTPEEGREWAREHGWFDNHHWILPMMPDRFVESRCIKCHFEMSSLEPSEQFPDPPAPKLMKGYNLIREMGCFGCHEINGFDSPTKRRCPDMRTEPVYFAAAEELQRLVQLTREQKLLADEIIAHPELESPRKRLAETILNPPAPKEGEKAPEYSTEVRKLAGILGANDEMPGQYRKVGPSLRHIASKVDFDFVYAWVRQPSDFRPSTKMPQFFGLYDHLKIPEPKLNKQGKVEMVTPGLDESEKFEPIEIRAISKYLLDVSQPFEYLDQPKNVTEKQGDVARGKQQFETRGCLACHQHPDFPEAQDTQGPNLAQLGSKLTGDRGRNWLYSWVRAPNRYHTRTVMPVLFLDPIAQPDGKVTDPAMDITAFLLASQTPAEWKHTDDGHAHVDEHKDDEHKPAGPWKPTNIPEFGDGESLKALDELTALYLRANYTDRMVTEYLKAGIPASAGPIKGDDALLVVDGKASKQELVDKKLSYVGRRTITRLGCSGCHDIPGFEDSKPIGTGLADWGRKEPSKLAFEQIVPYLEKGEFSHDMHKPDPGLEQDGVEDDEPHGIDVKNLSPNLGFFVEAVLSHKREGFLWQKLREPRSYDYTKTEGKPYTDRLRMPKFTAFNDEDREAVMTFVLGLVAEPPAARYVYQPDRRQGAIQKGKALLTKYNCTGCHTTRMEEWEFDYDPHSFPPSPQFPSSDYAFLKPYFTDKQLAESKKLDRRGLGHAKVSGMANPEVQEDDDGAPLWMFQIWQPTAINGQGWAVGGMDVPVQEKYITAKRPPHGGDLARLLHPVVLAAEQKSNPNAKASDAWGWVPPPLVNEGRKVQTTWLHNFLLDPYPIRPAVVLRMPKFNMSSDEASALVNYFAAVDDVDYPYEFDPRTRPEYLASEESKTPNRLPNALKIVTDNNFCVKCHLVGDFTPKGSVAALAPQLARVNDRLRHDYLRDWVANPKRSLPYTGMPQNIPADKPVSQELFPGDSLQQLDGLVDLLLNWATFLENKTPIAPMVKPAAAPPAAAIPATDSNSTKVSLRSPRDLGSTTDLAERTRTPTARQGD